MLRVRTRDLCFGRNTDEQRPHMSPLTAVTGLRCRQQTLGEAPTHQQPACTWKALGLKLWATLSQKWATLGYSGPSFGQLGFPAPPFGHKLASQGHQRTTATAEGLWDDKN